MTIKTQREMLAGWLWEMYARAWSEKNAKQAKRIGNILARITRAEHPITR